MDSIGRSPSLSRHQAYAGIIGNYLYAHTHSVTFISEFIKTLNPVPVLIELINSILAPVPAPLRGWMVIGLAGLAIYYIGSFSDDEPDDKAEQFFLGLSQLSSLLTWGVEGLGALIGLGAKLVVSAGIIGISALIKGFQNGFRVVLSKVGQLVEVEEAPIKVGPIIEIYGIKLGIGHVVLLGLGLSGGIVLYG